MSKRDTAPTNGEEGVRTKRRKESSINHSPGTASGSQAVNGGPANGLSVEAVKEQGLKWWQVLTEATSKDGRSISIDFLKQPPRRQYPDYYQQIKQPIALDDIKKKLDSNAYPTLESVKQDFDLCFKNARDYNIRESGIWKDAKNLQRIINKEYSKVTENDAGDAEDHAGGDEEQGDGDHKKSKAPNMYRLLKTRLTKVVEKTAEDGRVRSAMFMELPSKKDWPIYYKQIKRPVAIEGIFKHLKRKEYTSSADFARDVEQVFSNAMEFNQEGTQIWEDARILRDYFRGLMSDLPQPFALPQYSRPTTTTKIKLKVPAMSQIIGSTASTTQPAVNGATPSNQPQDVKATEPKFIAASMSPRVTTQPITASIVTPAAVATPMLPVAPMRATVKAVTPTVATPQPQKAQASPYVPTYPQQYYRAPSQSLANAATSSTSSTPTPAIAIAPSASPAPAPHRHQLQRVSLVTDPRGRRITLDHRDGVSSWAIRLGPGEKLLHVRRVEFLPPPAGDDDGVSGGDEEDEEEEEMMDVDEEVPAAVVKNGKKKKGKGRGRVAKPVPPPVSKPRVKKVKKPAPKVEEVQVKLNNFAVKEKLDSEGEWLVTLPVGMNTLEVGEKGGLVWKMYVERIADT